jgi:glucose-1-phosphate cytidylyltransferase
MIKRYFLDYAGLSGDMSINLASGQVESRNKECEDWQVHLIDTGLLTPTGGRVKRLQQWLSRETFAVTYGDGVSDINFDDLLRFHKAHGRVATVTAVRPPARFGGIIFDENSLVTAFSEKPQVGEGWINGGFLIFEPEVFAYLVGDESSLEADAMERLAADNQLVAYRHEGFWQCMDTLRDKRLLESLWSERQARWKVWD